MKCVCLVCSMSRVADELIVDEGEYYIRCDVYFSSGENVMLFVLVYDVVLNDTMCYEFRLRLGRRLGAVCFGRLVVFGRRPFGNIRLRLCCASRTEASTG